MSDRVTRLAPSPTGALHLGNARTFLINWAIARQRGWKIRLRIEDLDNPRVKPGSLEETIEILHWLGLGWDGEVLCQSENLDPYRAALHRLIDQKLAYQCRLSRREIQAASSAPHRGHHEIAYPRELRPATGEPNRWVYVDSRTNYRFVVPDREIEISDMIHGPVTHRPADEIGDFVIWTKMGIPSYQMAVVVDDARQGVTDVVRGDDLLASAARQTLLYEALGLQPPRWWHVPLVLGPDGRRLAKRHGDTRLSHYWAAGVSAERIIGLVALWSGAADARREMDAGDFADRFTVDTLDRAPVTFTQKDHEWLLSGISRSVS